MPLLTRFPLLAACLLSLLVVLLFVSARLYSSAPPAEDSPLLLGPSELRVVVGQGSLQGDVLVVDGFSKGQAIVSAKQRLPDAARYRYLEYDLRHGQAEEGLPLFFWRHTTDAALNISPLESSPLGVLDLSGLEKWEGSVTEFGFILEGGRGQTYRLGGLALRPEGFRQGSRALLAAWLEYEPWSQRSVNFLQGGRAAPGLSLTLLVAGWALLCLVIYLLLAGKRGRRAGGKILLLGLAGWLLLDGRWLYNLLRQAEITQAVYSGKTLEEKYLAGVDGEYFGWFEHLKKEFLPQEPVSIFVLHDSTPGIDYFRSKTPYFLAPHNIFNSGKYPGNIRAGDNIFILVLGNVQGLTYNPWTEKLRWGNNGVLSAELLNQHALGLLLKVPTGN